MALTAVLEFGDNNIKRYSKHFMVADCRFVFDWSYNDFCPKGETQEPVTYLGRESNLTSHFIK